MCAGGIEFGIAALFMAMAMPVSAESESYPDREAALLAEFPDGIARSDARLIVMTDGKIVAEFEDCPTCDDRPVYVAIDYFDAFERFVVAVLQYGEDLSYVLVDRKTGAQHWISAEPHLDQTGQRFVAVAVGDREPLWPGIEIGTVGNAGLVMEVDQRTVSGFQFDAWEGTDRVSLLCVSGPCVTACPEGIEENDGAARVAGTCTAELVRKDDTWHLVETITIPLGTRVESSDAP